MYAIVSFRKSDGTYPEVGTDNRTVWSDLKTERGVIRRANMYNKPYRVQLFHNIYGTPFKTIYSN